jgi:hypothetical protein
MRRGDVGSWFASGHAGHDHRRLVGLYQGTPSGVPFDLPDFAALAAALAEEKRQNADLHAN